MAIDRAASDIFPCGVDDGGFCSSDFFLAARVGLRTGSTVGW